MSNATPKSCTDDKVDLKNEFVQLLPVAAPLHPLVMSIEELESLRTSTAPMPASRHGLEIICGASCETGAQ